MPEAIALSDRIAVLYHGRLAAVFDPREASEQDVLLAIQGGSAASETVA